MKYQDKIFGEVKISEPIILDLINSPILQRLKGIDQAGYRPLWVKQPDIEIGKYGHSRFVHSLGVYILLCKYKTSLEEQIAGLIHDVSHSAFSHCIDYVLDEGSEKEQSHQDNVFENYVLKSEIPEILEKHGINVSYILNESNFPFQETELPDLCADRIEYSLRTAVIFGELEANDINYFFNNLVAKNNYWLFKNFDSAKKYAELFLKLNTKYYSGISSAVMFRTVGDYLKYALKKKYIKNKDLYKTDDYVLQKINVYLNNDNYLDKLWQRMNNKVRVENNPNKYDAHVFCKSRVVDPLLVHKGKLKRVSDIDIGWKKVLQKESKPKEYFIRFLD